MDTKSRGGLEDLMGREVRTCKACGANFSATDENEFCPICLLRNALAGGVQSEEPSSTKGLEPAASREGQRLDITSW